MPYTTIRLDRSDELWNHNGSFKPGTNQLLRDSYKGFLQGLLSGIQKRFLHEILLRDLEEFLEGFA